MSKEESMEIVVHPKQKLWDYIISMPLKARDEWWNDRRTDSMYQKRDWVGLLDFAQEYYPSNKIY